MKKISRFAIWIAILVGIMISGTAGYMVVESYTFIEALYMTVITLSTIGYGETHPLSETGKIFNICFIIFSFAVFTYALTNLTSLIASGDMALYFKKRRLMKAIEKFSNHIIICGFGRHGQQAAKILAKGSTDFLVIDTSPAPVGYWLPDNRKLIYMVGDATDDEVLLKAGLGKARVLLTTLPEDADNVFIVLSARAVNKSLNIISRAQAKSTEAKLHSAGANHVVLPEVLGGTHMATLISKPDLIEFINNLWGDGIESTNLETFSFEELPEELKGRTVHEIICWNETGVNCLGIQDEEGKFYINPSRETQIKEKMKILLFGSTAQIAELKRYLKEAST